MQTKESLAGQREIMFFQINSAGDKTPSLFVASKEHLFSELKSEGVILSLTNGKYYGVNEVGVTIWKIIQNPASLKEIQTAVTNEYDVADEKCYQEVLSFLTEMSKEGLVNVLNEESI